MPIWIFFCATCNTNSEQLFSTYEASLLARCATCGSAVERLPVSGSFVVTGYNAKNLYSKKN